MQNNKEASTKPNYRNHLVTQSPNHLITFPKVAFTLAETLITLAIIGVVAALTIPNLVAKYQKRQTVVRLQKAYSEISQAMKMIETEHGFMENWSWSDFGSTREEIQNNFTKNYLKKYIKIAKECSTNNINECIKYPIKGLNNTDVYTNDLLKAILTTSGYSVYLWFGGSSEDSPYSEHLHFIIDIDGPNKGDSILGKDVFIISANFKEQQAVSEDIGSVENSPKKSGIYFYGNGWIPELTRDELKNNSYGCSKDKYGHFCGALIQRDNWEIKEDYPWE